MAAAIGYAIAMDLARPFALIADGRGGARLFTAPSELIAADAIGDVEAALGRMEQALAAGRWLAGGIGYACGAALEPRLGATAPPRGDVPQPLLWFGCFGAPGHLGPERLAALLGALPQRAWWGEPEPLIAPAAHAAAVRRIQEWIAAGDIYQANFTFSCRLPFGGHPAAMFARLATRGHSPWSALVHCGEGRWWLSLSPELFFGADGGRLTARPMKGTAPRGADHAADAATIAALRHDPKNRAENLMITDLLRNDLSRVAAPGTVRTEALWEVETYPTLHQMTSTVTARLGDGLGPVDVLRALFPCGSVTGAPKIRAMEIIAATEQHPRGIYCGSIGWAGPDGDCGFNVAIRTIAIQGSEAVLGLGSGIVADSDAAAEWAECRLKAAFLRPPAPRTLIETMPRSADGSIPRLDLHLARLGRSARHFGFPFDPAAARALVGQAAAGRPQRVRLLLSAGGALALQLSPAPPPRAAPLRLALGPSPLAADDWRLAHKSSDRAMLDSARWASGADEVLFLDAAGFATEGSFTSIFVKGADGRFRTPPAARGLLPGVLRESLLQGGEAAEADLCAADLRAAAGTGRLFVGNALRGLMPGVFAPGP